MFVDNLIRNSSRYAGRQADTRVGIGVSSARCWASNSLNVFSGLPPYQEVLVPPEHLGSGQTPSLKASGMSKGRDSKELFPRRIHNFMAWFYFSEWSILDDLLRGQIRKTHSARWEIYTSSELRSSCWLVRLVPKTTQYQNRLASAL